MTRIRIFLTGILLILFLLMPSKTQAMDWYLSALPLWPEHYIPVGFQAVFTPEDYYEELPEGTAYTKCEWSVSKNEIESEPPATTGCSLAYTFGSEGEYTVSVIRYCYDENDNELVSDSDSITVLVAIYEGE